MAKITHLNTLFQTTLWSAAPSWVVYGSARIGNPRFAPDVNMLSNHGPWWDTWQGLLIFFGVLSLVVLLLATVAYSIYGALSLAFARQKSGIFLGWGLALVIAQIAIIVEQAFTMAWTVD